MSTLSRPALGLLLGAVLGGASCGSTQLTIQTYSSSAEPISVNSHLILGPSEAVLIDAQLFKADAQSVVDLIKSTGKKLTTVFLTHAHPDHYAGLDVIRQAFPGAAVVTTQEVLDDFKQAAPGMFTYLKSTYGALLADNLITPNATTSDTLTVDGQEVKILKYKGGEATTSAVLMIPSLGAVFTGDHVYGNVHLFIGECTTDQWKTNLGALKGVAGAKKYYPGHGAAGGPEVLDADTQYLTDARPILDSGKMTSEIIAGLKQKYPTYSGLGLLSLSVPRYTAACGPRLELPGATYYPESLHAAADGTVYVGSVATGQVQKFAGGTGAAATFVPASATNGISGVLVDDANGALWACSVDPTFKDPTKNKLVRYKLSDGSLLGSYTLAGGAGNFCNDMTLDPAGNLYVADSFGKIHKVVKGSATATVWSTDPLLAPSTSSGFGADGIAYDAAGSNIYVNTFSDSRLLRIPVKVDGTAGTAVVINVTPALVNPDGMRMDGANLLVIEGGAGRLSKLTVSGATAAATALQTDLYMPTAVVKANGKYYVAEGQLGHLLGQVAAPPNLPFKVRVFPAQ